jgi:hypothetical protein
LAERGIIRAGDSKRRKGKAGMGHAQRRKIKEDVDKARKCGQEVRR